MLFVTQVPLARVRTLLRNKQVPLEFVGGILTLVATEDRNAGHAMALVPQNGKLVLCDSNEVLCDGHLNVPWYLDNDGYAILVFDSKPGQPGGRSKIPERSPLRAVQQKSLGICVSSSVYALLMHSRILDAAPDTETKRAILASIASIRKHRMSLPHSRNLPHGNSDRLDSIQSERARTQLNKQCPMFPRKVMELYKKYCEEDFNFMLNNTGTNVLFGGALPPELIRAVFDALQLDYRYSEDKLGELRPWSHYAKLAKHMEQGDHMYRAFDEQTYHVMRRLGNRHSKRNLEALRTPYTRLLSFKKHLNATPHFYRAP